MPIGYAANLVSPDTRSGMGIIQVCASRLGNMQCASSRASFICIQSLAGSLSQPQKQTWICFMNSRMKTIMPPKPWYNCKTQRPLPHAGALSSSSIGSTTAANVGPIGQAFAKSLIKGVPWLHRYMWGDVVSNSD